MHSTCKFILFVLLKFTLAVSISFSASAQEHTVDSVYTKADQPPVYKDGGPDGMIELVRRNLRYPQDALKQGIEGKAFVAFTVDKEGRQGNLEVLQSVGGGCDEEALRVLGLLEKWEPAKVSGMPVVYKFVVPVSFTLHDNSSERRRKNK